MPECWKMSNMLCNYQGKELETYKEFPLGHAAGVEQNRNPKCGGEGSLWIMYGEVSNFVKNATSVIYSSIISWYILGGISSIASRTFLFAFSFLLRYPYKKYWWAINVVCKASVSPISNISQTEIRMKFTHFIGIN